MDRQMLLYDTRLPRGFNGRPTLEFGRRATSLANTTARRASGTSTSSATPVQGSRYTRGSTMNSLFARGYPDGAVCVWDFRNGAREVSSSPSS